MAKQQPLSTFVHRTANSDSQRQACVQGRPLNATLGIGHARQLTYCHGPRSLVVACRRNKGHYSRVNNQLGLKTNQSWLGSGVG